MKRSKPIARSTRVNVTRSTPRRVFVHRDREYLDWLMVRGCVACFIEHGRLHWKGGVLCDPAHGPSAGKGLKGPDKEAIPLCRHHHVEQHGIGWQEFEAKYSFSREHEAEAHYAVYQLEKG